MRLLRLLSVFFSDENIRIIADCSVALVKYDENDIFKRNTTSEQIILNHLRRRNNNKSIIPKRRALLCRNASSEDDHAARIYIQYITQERCMLLHKRSRRCKEKDFASSRSALAPSSSPLFFLASAQQSTRLFKFFQNDEQSNRCFTQSSGQNDHR